MLQNEVQSKPNVYTWAASFFSDSALGSVFSEVAEGWDSVLSTVFAVSSWAGVSS